MEKSVYANRHDNLAGDLTILHAVRDQHGDLKPMTYDAIAEVVGCSRSLIRHIEEKALKKLRHPTRLKLIQDGVR